METQSVLNCFVKHKSGTYIHRQTDIHTLTLRRVKVCLDKQGKRCRQAPVTDIDSHRALEGHILLFVSRVPAFGSVGAVGGGDRVDGGTLFAWRMGWMGRMGEAGSRLASVVVKLHQAEYQVWGHQLKCIRWIGYDISRGKRDQMWDQL